MKVSQKGLDLIKKYEGFYPKAYLDVVGITTIGFGTTKYANGQSVKLGDTITQSEALKLLETQVNEHASTISTYVKVELNINQFDALASFQYNLGKHILKGSKLLEYLNAKNWTKASETMLLYCNASGKPLQGLINRRKAEIELFNTPVSTITSPILSLTKEGVIMLNETGRKEARLLIKRAVKEGVFDAKFHTDAKIDKYTDGELVSYAIAYVNRKLK